ncbi:hypothetical protein OHR68_06670 [Spirillospora sp. NBC_00431]
MTDYSGVRLGAEHIDRLRSFLLGDSAGTQEPGNPADKSDLIANTLMIYAAFAVAVRRKFSPTYTLHQIIQYVAELRIALMRDATVIDPGVTESIIRTALGDASVDKDSQVDTRKAVRAELAVLEDLLSESVADQPGLEEFLQDAEGFARQWLARQQASAG